MAKTGSSTINRRGILKAGVVGGIGLTAAALIGCGSSTPPASGTAPAAAGGVIAAPGEKRPYPAVIAASDKSPKRGGTLVIPTTSAIATFDIAKSGANGNLIPAGIMYDSLLRRKLTVKDAEMRGTGDPQKDIEGHLAQSWEVSPDGLSIVFKIRPGVKWQNVAPVSGRPFVAEDVVNSFKRYSTTGIWQDYYEAVTKVESPDAATVKVTLKRPTPDFIVPLAEQNNPVLPRELVDNGTIDKVAIGTGPMILKEAVPGQTTKWVRNPDYWGSAPYLDGYEMRIIADSAATLAAFRAEQIGTVPSANVRSVKAIEGTNPNIQTALARPYQSGFHTSFNMKLPKWQDERVRQALSLLMDRDEVNNILYDGLSVTQPNFPWPFVLDKAPTAAELGKWWRYDAAEAKKLLQAAGQENLKFDWLYYNVYLGDQNAVIIDQWKRAGIGINPQAVDYVTFNSQLASVSYPDAMCAWDPHGSLADNFFKGQVKSNSGTNVFNIKDPQLDTWADQQSVELDPRKRREILRKIWDRVLDKMYYIDHTNALTFTSYQPWLHGMQYAVGAVGGGGPTVFGYDNGKFLPSIWIDK